MNQADWDLYIKSAQSSSGKAYQQYYRDLKAEEEKKKKNEIAFGDSTSNKAAAVEGSKSFWSKAGDVAKSIGSGMVESYKRVGTGFGEVLGEATGQNQKIRDSYAKQQETNLNLIKTAGSKMNDTNLSQEERDRWKKLFESAAKDNSSYTEATQYAKEQAEKTDPVKGAAAVGEIGLDIITGGSAGSAIRGAKATSKTAKALNAVNKSKVAKAVEKVIAPTGIKQTAKSGAIIGATYGAVDPFMYNGTDTSVGDVAKGTVTGGTLGGILGLGAGWLGNKISKHIETKTDKLSTMADDISATDAELTSVIDGIKSDEANATERAAIETRVQDEYNQMIENRNTYGTDDGSKFINLKDVEQEIADMQSGKYTDDLYDIKLEDGSSVTSEQVQNAISKQSEELQKLRDEIAKQVDSIQDPDALEMAMQKVNKLDDQIAQLNDSTLGQLIDTQGSGVSRTLNTDKVRERFTQLQNDLAMGRFREKVAQDEALKRTMPRRTYDSASGDIDALGAGGVAPEAVTPRADYADISEVAAEAKMPTPVRVAATRLTNDLREVQMQRVELMTTDRANLILDEAGAAHKQQAQRIEMMPEPRYTAEMDRIDAEFQDIYTRVQDQLEADAARVQELDRVEAQINANINEVMADANLIKDRNPTEFGTIDETLNNKISEEIRDDAETAIFNRMSGSDGVSDAENVNKAFAEMPVDKIDEAVKSPEVAALTQEAIQDTFINESYKELNDSLISRNLNITYTGASFSSNNMVLEKLFGQTGVELYGNTIRGYADTNIANSVSASKLASIQEGLGGSKELYSKLVDVLEGKKVDTSTLTDVQNKAFQDAIDIRDQATRLVKKAAYNEKKYQFANRSLGEDIHYTVEEIKQLAKRDGITAREASEKYGNITAFNKKDVEYIAAEYSNNSTIDNYYPHMFDGNGIEKPNFSDSEYVKSDGDVRFGNMMHRVTDGDNYSRDFIDVFSRYFAGLNKKVYLEPSLRKLDNVKMVIKIADSEANPVWQWVDKYQAQLKYNKPDAVGKSFNELVDRFISNRNPNSEKIGQNHYRTMLSTQRQVNAMAALGLSFRNGLQQITQFGTAIGNLGTKDVMVGLFKYMKGRYNPASKAQYIKMLDAHGITNAGIAKEAYSELLSDGLSGAIKTKGEKFTSYLMIMTQRMDELARGSTYEASLVANLRKGIPKAKAEALATADAARFNFLTSKVDMPLKLNGDTVRSLTQFMTFSYKQAEAWKRIGINAVKDPVTGKYGLRPKEMSRLLQMVAFYGTAFYGMSKIAGIDPEDNIPFYGNIAGDNGLPKSPLISTLFGNGSTQDGLIEIISGLVAPDGSSDFDKEENRKEMFEKFTDMMIRSFVPAGSQGKKSWEGYQSTQNDGVVSRDGKVRFIQNTDEASKLKATLFGKYSTDAGREWINKEFPTLSEKQSEILNKQSDAEAKKRAYDFYSGLKSVGTKGTITPKIKETMATQPNKAERLISDHNKAVEEAIKAYTSKYGGLSEYEQDYLLQNYFITKGNLENITEED